MRTAALLAMALVALVPSLGLSDDTLAKFEGGIGADGVSSAAGTAPVAIASPATSSAACSPAPTSGRSPLSVPR